MDSGIPIHHDRPCRSLRGHVVLLGNHLSVWDKLSIALVYAALGLERPTSLPLLLPPPAGPPRPPGFSCCHGSVHRPALLGLLEAPWCFPCPPRTEGPLLSLLPEILFTECSFSSRPSCTPTSQTRACKRHRVCRPCDSIPRSSRVVPPPRTCRADDLFLLSSHSN